MTSRASREPIKPLNPNEKPAWQHSHGGSSLSKKKINKRMNELLNRDANVQSGSKE